MTVDEKTMKVLVVGATGQTGRWITQQLGGSDFDVRALVRDRAKADFADAVEVVVGDVLKAATLRDAIAGCDAIICATGAAPSFDITGPYQVDFVGTKNLVDAAKKDKYRASAKLQPAVEMDARPTEPIRDQCRP